MDKFSLIHLSPLPPTQCGIAEYTAALDRHLHGIPGISSHYIRLDFDTSGAKQDQNVITVNPANEMALYWAAEQVNRLPRKVLMLQHEFKLYGGTDGENIVPFINAMNAPVVTTLHTVWPSFPSVRRDILLQLIRRSSFVLVFSDKAAAMLVRIYGADSAKVRVIPHGVQDIPFRKPGQVEYAGVPHSRLKLISLGLIRPSKGIETAVLALRLIKEDFKDFTYLICGVNHPRDLRSDEYRRRLVSIVDDYRLKKHVLFVDRFLTAKEMINIVQCCDVGVLTYTRKEQSSSGVLSFLFACGRPVITTDFQYAVTTVKRKNGIIVPMGDAQELAAAIKRLALNQRLRERMMEHNFKVSRAWRWSVVAQSYLKIAEEANVGWENLRSCQ